MHGFIAGSGEVFTTLRRAPRRVLLEGQLNNPGDPKARLYSTRFCRECGQELHIVYLPNVRGRETFISRDIVDTPMEQQPDADLAGYLTPAGGNGDVDYHFNGEPENYPEHWQARNRPNVVSLKLKLAAQPRTFCETLTSLT